MKMDFRSNRTSVSVCDSTLNSIAASLAALWAFDAMERSNNSYPNTARSAPKMACRAMAVGSCRCGSDAVPVSGEWVMERQEDGELHFTDHLRVLACCA